jgi:mannose/fructose/N-acetylgalactosamine-specific phosphotransferase system component IID
MSAVGRAVGSLAAAAVLIASALVVVLAASWATGWSITVPGVLSVARVSEDATQGIAFDPNALGLVVLAALLATLLAARPGLSAQSAGPGRS